MLVRFHLAVMLDLFAELYRRVGLFLLFGDDVRLLLLNVFA